MTPQQKAIELLDKMTFEIGKFNSKQCALIAVDEIISTCAFNDYKTKKYFEHCNDYDDSYFWTYWEEVKQEINLL
jgi:hypothetical protein